MYKDVLRMAVMQYFHVLFLSMWLHSLPLTRSWHVIRMPGFSLDLQTHFEGIRH